MNNRYRRVILLPEGETVRKDTLLIEFREAPVTETHDLDENTVMDFDAKSNICSITIEHAFNATVMGRHDLPPPRAAR